jgi:maltooligosyltrehalose trehalohydrolase
MARQVSEGRQKEFAAFGWNPESIPDPEDRRTFQVSKLVWEELSAGQHSEMRSWYKGLIHLRRSTPDLNNGEPGNVQVTWDEEQFWFLMRRGCISVGCNLDAKKCHIPVAKDCSLLLTSTPETTVEEGRLALPSNSVAILRAI